MSRPFSPIVVGLALFGAACSSDSAAPVAPTADAVPHAAESFFAKAGASTDGLLACPSSVTVAGDAVIGEEGGTLSVAGHGLYVPPGAVKKPTRFTLTAPASSVLEVDVSADGKKEFKFKSPVLVRLSYARCASVSDDLVGWWIEGGVRGKHGAMPSVHDRATQSVWITTDHLSGYAIAYRNGRGNGGGEEENEQR